MRVLLLLRGAPGCGKSTWIEENNLRQYTLSADDIRMMCTGPKLNVEGREQIDQSNDQVVWQILFKLLDIRMQHGEFTVIDATNSKTSEMNRYKELCASYKYRIYCVDFTDIPIEVVKQRNRQRAELKQVPDYAIDKMYARFATQKIPSGITVLKPDELNQIWMERRDLSEYNKIHVIGDIHGCNTVLQEYLGGTLKDDECYIFCGDYIDRGIENAEVVNFLLSVYEQKNVYLLEGNHERSLWLWASGATSPSKEFEFVTKTQLENAGVEKRTVRKLYRRIGQCAYFTYGGNVYLVTHAGLSTIPPNLTFVSTSQMIRGVGSYSESEYVDHSFERNTTGNFFQIHGHRNVKHVPVRATERCFNLEGNVEFGGNLRCVVLNKDGSQEVFETKNRVFKIPEEVTPEKKDVMTTVGDAILAMRESKYIQEKRFGNISSFNFTRDAFYNKAWDEQTTKARGLYINVPKQCVVARAYDKFFNINERPETKMDVLRYKLQFPVTAYVKENGFLGIVSYNAETDDLFITTKSNPDGEYAGWLKQMIYEKLSDEAINGIRTFSKTHNVSFVFECVDMEHDPHIIDYGTSQLFLLDIVYNDLTYRKMCFKDLCSLADRYGIHHKEKAFVIESWQEFFDWYYEVLDENYKYNGRDIEGFVVEDIAGYMVKLKLTYYNFWKFMRSIAQETIRKGYIDGRRTSTLTTPLANQFYGWIKNLCAVQDRDTIQTDICSLRKMFYES